MTSLYDARFNDQLAALRAHLDTHGHLDDLSTQSPLGRWCYQQKARYRAGTLAPGRLEALEALDGWSWESRSRGPRPRAARNAEIRRLRAEGVTLEELAGLFNVSKQRVHQLTSDVAPGPRRRFEDLEPA